MSLGARRDAIPVCCSAAAQPAEGPPGGGLGWCTSQLPHLISSLISDSLNSSHFKALHFFFDTQQHAITVAVHTQVTILHKITSLQYYV